MLTIDSRERVQHPWINNGLIKNLGQSHVATDLLRFGDYRWDGHEVNGRVPTIGIEHSTITDFLGKIDSGRLAFQMSGMLETYNFPVLLIDGELRPDKQGNVRVWGAPITFSYDRAKETIWSLECHGITVEYAANRSDVTRRLVHWYRYWQKPLEQHKLLRAQDAELQLGKPTTGNTSAEDRLYLPLGPKLDRAVSVLMASTRGLGATRARAALEKFGRLDYIFTLNEKQLASIPGWGPGIAKNFHDTATTMFKRRIRRTGTGEDD